jgi:2-keto-3-deoxy-L-rhamnonate aldolase RhmA
VLKNPFMAGLQQGRTLVGFWHVIRDLAVTESMRAAALDFMVVDMQHLAIGLPWIEQVVVTLQASPIAVIVRVPENDPIVIGQVLDIGVDGVVVPMVDTAEDARRAVAAARYPPTGVRSWGPRRYPRFAGAEEYAREANENAAVIVQIETARALAEMNQIISVQGVTSVMVGPADLAISMGYSEDRGNPAVTEAAVRVRDACERQAVPFGFFAGPLAEAQDWLARRARVVACETDLSLLMQGLAQVAAGADNARAVGVPGA